MIGKIVFEDNVNDKLKSLLYGLDITELWFISKLLGFNFMLYIIIWVIK
jgi:hypothetical protein